MAQRKTYRALATEIMEHHDCTQASREFLAGCLREIADEFAQTAERDGLDAAVREVNEYTAE